MPVSPQLRTFARRNWLSLLALSVAALVGLWLCVSMVADFIYFNDPRHQDEALKPWMTPRYVGLSYALPRPVVAEALGLTVETLHGQRMTDIADSLDLDLDALTERVRSAAEAHRDAQQ